MKKIICILLSITMLLSVMVIGVSAANTGATPANAIKVSFGQKYYGGWNSDNDHLNYYTYFKTTSQGLVSIELSKPYDDEGEPGGYQLILYDVDGNTVWTHESYDEEANIKSTYNYTVGLKAGEYYLNILPGFWVSSGYIDFNYKFTFSKTSYCETEPNDTIPEATPMTLGHFYTGYYGASECYEEGADDYEFYKFKVTKGVKYRVRFKDIKKLGASSTMLDVIMNGEEIEDFWGLYDMVDQYDSAGCAYEDFVAPASGYAYLKFSNYSVGAPIKYEVEVDECATKCSTPKLKSASNTTTGIEVTWNKVTGAKTYRVYRKTASTSWTCLNSKVTSTSYIDKTAKSGTTYYYTVRAENNAGLSGYNSTGVSVKCLAVPAVTVANAATGVKVSWNKISGASKYYVYRKASGATSWTRLTTSATGTSYTDKTAKSGTTYYYTVKAVSGSVASASKSSSALKYLAMPKVSSLSNTNSSITVKWGKVTGASGYYVYRKTGSGSWSLIYTAKSGSTVSYIDKTAKAGTTYYYTVRAYNGSVKSTYTSSSAIRRLTTPTLNSVSSAKSGITLKWGKVTGASGYYVYRKTGSGSWERIATVNSGSTVSYLDKTAKKGTTYTYTVKAYYGSSVSHCNATGLTIKDKY